MFEHCLHVEGVLLLSLFYVKITVANGTTELVSYISWPVDIATFELKMAKKNKFFHFRNSKFES